MTFENLAAWGRCLCAVCPSPTTIVTSGASAVVCIWELSMAKGRPRGLHLKQVCWPQADMVHWEDVLWAGTVPQHVPTT